MIGVALKGLGAFLLFGLAILGRDAVRRFLPNNWFKRLLLLRLYRADWERGGTEAQRPD